MDIATSSLCSKEGLGRGLATCVRLIFPYIFPVFWDLACWDSLASVYKKFSLEVAF